MISACYFTKDIRADSPAGSYRTGQVSKVRVKTVWSPDLPSTRLYPSVLHKCPKHKGGLTIGSLVLPPAIICSFSKPTLVSGTTAVH